jgi:thioredoxin-dependent peroxiredoxin
MRPQERDIVLKGERLITRVVQRMSLAGMLSLWLMGVVGGVSIAIALEVGEKAPDFTLPSTTGEQISLSQFQGKQHVLLEFYGVDFAPVCVSNLSARKADYSKFQALNVQLLGISTNHPFSQKTLAESLQLPYPLLSDFPDLRVTWQYGGLSLNNTLAQFGIAERAFFLIDKEGVVRQRWLINGGKRWCSPVNRS